MTAHQGRGRWCGFILEAGAHLVVRQQWDAVAVLSTNLTAKSDIYRLLIRQMARRKVQVIQEGVPRLINLIASGDFDGEATRHEIASCCSRFAEAGIQALVPGCTHLIHSADVFRHYFPGVYVDPVGECVDMVEAKFGEDRQSSFSSTARLASRSISPMSA
jgi:glutamate racemase